MPHRRPVPVNVAGDIPDLQRPVSRCGDNLLLIMEEPGAGDLVSMTDELMDHPLRSEVPDPAGLVAPASYHKASADIKPQHWMSARPSQDCPLLAGVGVPDLDGRVGAARRYQVGPGRIVPNGGGLLHVRLEGVKRFGGQDDAHGTEHPLPLPVNVFL